MNQEDLIQPLQAILEASHTLLTEHDGLLSVSQEQCLQAIVSVTSELSGFIVSLPEGHLNRRNEVLSFEARSHLTSIIGYADVLLEQTPLTPNQQELVYTIRDYGRYVLDVLVQGVES